MIHRLCGLIRMKTIKELEFEVRQLRFINRKAKRKHEKWKFISLMLTLFVLLLLFSHGFKIGC